jgi:hypothetical protein
LASKTLKGAIAEGESLTALQAYDIIRKYLEEQIELAQREMLDKTKFELTAWSEHQAYQLGSIKANYKLLDFIPNLDQRK